MDVKYGTYVKNGSNNWSDFPTATPGIEWGDNVDGGQWLTVSTTVGTLERIWGQFQFQAVSGVTYLLSFTVDSKSGIISAASGYSVAVVGITSTGTPGVGNPAIGRHVLRFIATSTGTATVRVGIGDGGPNANNASIRYSQVMLEIPSPSSRVFPYEYVTPNDARAFNYTYIATPSGTLVGNPTLGTPYQVAKTASVLVIGDSFTNDPPVPGIPGDFPFQMMDVTISPHAARMAVSTRGVGGSIITQQTTQFINAMAETNFPEGALPWSVCICQGSINDVNTGRTLQQLIGDKTTQIDTVVSYGVVPVLMTLAPFHSATAGQQIVIDGFNQWLRSLNLPLYDVFQDASDGANMFKTSWGSVDGVHPGTSFEKGQTIMAKKLSDLLFLIDN